MQKLKAGSTEQKDIFDRVMTRYNQETGELSQVLQSET